MQELGSELGWLCDLGCGEVYGEWMLGVAMRSFLQRKRLMRKHRT